MTSAILHHPLQLLRLAAVAPARAHVAAGLALQRLLELPAAASGSSGASGGLRLVPRSADLPGGSKLQDLTNGIGAWALIASLVGLVVGAGTWALGAHSNNYQHTLTGRRAVLVSAVAALLIGFAPRLLNFMFSTGHAAK